MSAFRTWIMTLHNKICENKAFEKETMNLKGMVDSPCTVWLSKYLALGWNGVFGGTAQLTREAGVHNTMDGK